MSKKVKVTCALLRAEWVYKVNELNYLYNGRKKELLVEWKYVGNHVLNEYDFDGDLLSKDMNIFINNEVGYRPILEVNVSKDIINYHINYAIKLDIEGKNRRTTAIEEMFTTEYPTFKKFDELNIYNPKTNDVIKETDADIFKDMEESSLIEVNDTMFVEDSDLLNFKTNPSWVIGIVSIFGILGWLLLFLFLIGGM